LGQNNAVKVVYLYAAVLALIFIVLSVRTIRLRGRLRIAIGDAGNASMQRAMRAHSNFAEYVPLALLLQFFVESSGASPAVLHGMGACLVVGRVSHAIGVSQVREPRGFRLVGMLLTIAAIVSASIYLLRLQLA